jgi:DNA-binding transcriptional ArsR family regulator
MSGKAKRGPIMVPCGHCHGHGRVLLTGVYADTLRILRDCSGEHTGADLARIAGTKPTAMNNRLARLEELGLATSHRYGRKRLYRATKETS